MRRYINLKTITILITTAIISLLIINPTIAIKSVLDGIKLWYYNVMPSLFPYMIFSNILFQLNITYYLQKIFNNVTYRAFNVSGSGMLPITMGYISGYPLGGKLVCDLRKNEFITLKESYKLLAVCSTTGPAFIIGVVSIQMFDNTSIIPVLLIANYLGSILNIILVKTFFKETLVTNIYKRFEAKSFSHILNESIVESIKNVIKIGGYMVFFNLIVSYLDSINVIDFVTGIFSRYFNFINASSELIKGLFFGFFEITLGINIISQCNDPMLVKVSITSLIIAWSGLSIHMQTNSFLVETDIKYSLFLLFKTTQSIISLVISLITYTILYPKAIDVYKVIESAESLRGFNLNIFYSSSIMIIIFMIILTYFANRST